MKTKSIHIASSYQMGLTNQETQLAIAYKKIPELESIVVTGEKEQYNGLFKLLATHDIPNIIIDGFDFHKSPIRLIKEFIKITHFFNPDIVTVNTNWQLLIAGLSKFTTKSHYKIIYTIHGFRNNSRFKSKIARLIIGSLLWIFSDKINAPTSYVANKFKFLKNKITIIPLGEDDSFFDQICNPDFSKPLNFCFPGVFREGKNQDILIYAYSEYLKRSNDIDGKLFLPGEGSLRDSCINLTQKLGISNRVIFPGQLNRSEMINLYCNCQVAIIPSNDETFGHCIAEPLILGRIVVTRKIGLAPDYIIDSKNGFFFDSKDDLINVLTRIKNSSDGFLNKISENASQTASHFNWDNIAEQHLKKLFNFNNHSTNK